MTTALYKAIVSQICQFLLNQNNVGFSEKERKKKISHNSNLHKFVPRQHSGGKNGFIIKTTESINIEKVFMAWKYNYYNIVIVSEK